MEQEKEKTNKRRMNINSTKFETDWPTSRPMLIDNVDVFYFQKFGGTL